MNWVSDGKSGSLDSASSLTFLQLIAKPHSAGIAASARKPCVSKFAQSSPDEFDGLRLAEASIACCRCYCHLCEQHAQPVFVSRGFASRVFASRVFAPDDLHRFVVAELAVDSRKSEPWQVFECVCSEAVAVPEEGEA